ncbi:MAG TPA: response regulator [Candidatus Acidoferrales bacterium]|nr:response regulator [Candidatus Acidoferrales bacterium]
MIFIAVAFCRWPLQASNATNDLEFAALLPASGSWQRAANQKLDAQRQELYRRRVRVPQATGRFAPRAASARLLNGPAPPLALPAPANAHLKWFDLPCFTGIVVLTFVLFARKFAPEILLPLGRHFNPWIMPLAAGMPAYVRSEEKPFHEFLEALRAGPARAARPQATGPADAHAEFLARAKQHLVAQRKLLQGIRAEASDAARQKLLADLYFQFGLLKDLAGLPDALPVWRVAASLEGLLKEHVTKIRNTTPSTLRTIEGGLDLLDRLCQPGSMPGNLTESPFRFLVVDDELISRHALSLSLKKAFSEPDLAVDGPTALEQTSRQAYDVIFLDVQMPGMDGFELCEKIHASGPNRATPVVFVTNHTDFEARARSTLVGGHDLMAKPFLIFEVTAKALTLALQGRLRAQELPPTASTQAARELKNSTATAPDNPQVVSGSVLPRRIYTPAPPSTSDDPAEAFLDRAVQQLDALRELGNALLETPDVAARQNLLTDVFLRLNSFIANAPEITHPAFQLGNALEGLVRKLLQDATRSTPSALATLADAVALLDDLCTPGSDVDLAVSPAIRLLVVDDDPVARRALAGALQTNFERPASVQDGEAALALAYRERFDVIFLDLQMPGLNGFETCEQIRGTECNRDTPVVFVTAHADFDARAEMVRIGGNDLVEKPFLTAEINLKALTLAVRGRLRQVAAAEA